MSLFDSRYPEASNIFVGTMSEALKAENWCDGIITIENIGVKRPVRIENGDKVEQLILAFDDIDFGDEDLLAGAHQIESALIFARRHQDRNLFIHCHAGQSRSPAVALAIIADRMGYGREEEAVDALKVVRNWSTPNMLVVALADRLLQRDGMLVNALKSKGNAITRMGVVGLLRRPQLPRYIVRKMAFR